MVCPNQPQEVHRWATIRDRAHGGRAGGGSVAAIALEPGTDCLSQCRRLRVTKLAVRCVGKRVRLIECPQVTSPDVDSLRVLLSTYLFQDLSPAELEPLVKALHSRDYLRGEYVFRAGDTAEFLYILAVGQIKYSMNTAKGDEWVLEIMTPGAVFGEPGLFAPERTRVVDALAMQRSSVLLVGRGRLIDFMQKHRPAMMRMLEALAAEG